MTDDAENEKELFRVSAILESIAAQYPEDSPECLAIRDAALAFSIVNHHKFLLAQFRASRELLGGEISEETKQHFKARGIDFDALEAEDQF
ncbi:MAG: hypothetical protein U0903_12865 [Planctomycetales bacterium]